MFGSVMYGSSGAVEGVNKRRGEFLKQKKSRKQQYFENFLRHFNTNSNSISNANDSVISIIKQL